MRGYAGLMQACGAAAALLVAAMTVLVGADVLMRNTGWGSLDWVLDISEYMLPWAICLSTPWLMWRNQHIRLDVLNMVLSPVWLRRVDRLTALVGAVASGLFAWYALQLLLAARTDGTLVFKALVFPEWWTFIPVPIGFGLLAVECLRRLVWPPADDHTPEATHAADAL